VSMAALTDRLGDVIGEVCRAPEDVPAGAGDQDLAADTLDVNPAPRDVPSIAVERCRAAGCRRSHAIPRKTVSTGTRSSSRGRPGASGRARRSRRSPARVTVRGELRGWTSRRSGPRASVFEPSRTEISIRLRPSTGSMNGTPPRDGRRNASMSVPTLARPFRSARTLRESAHKRPSAAASAPERRPAGRHRVR
jgi:hypothetical protein